MPFCLSHFSVNCIRWHTITSRRAHTKYACMMYSWPDERVCVYLTCVWWAANFEIISVHASAFPWSRTSRFRRFFDAVLQHTPSRFGPEKFQTRRPRRGLWSPNLCLQVQDTDSCRTRSPRASLHHLVFTEELWPYTPGVWTRFSDATLRSQDAVFSETRKSLLCIWNLTPIRTGFNFSESRYVNDSKRCPH